jgi:putative transposase
MTTMTTLRPELLDELLAGAKTSEEIFGREGVIKRLTGALVERVLQAELAAHLEAERVAAAPVRTGNRRNGHTPKTLQTDQGPVPIQVPRDREATFAPVLVPKHQTRIAGLDEKIVALYARGLSVREIQHHLAELYGTEISPALISNVTEAVYDEVRAWQHRPLEAVYAVVWLDALMVKVRDQGAVQTKAAYVAIGLNLEGHREVLGLWLESTEGAKFWLRVLNELRQRGVQDILIACCDGLKGFPQAIEATFAKTVVQTCLVHQVRHSLNFVPWQDRKAVAADLRAIYTAENEACALDALAAFERTWAAKYPMIAKSWRANWAHLVPFLAYPPEIRRIIYTTNAIESLNYQLRKVIRTKGHFPNDDAAIKLLFLALRNAERRWVGTALDWKRMYNQLLIHFGDRIAQR